MHTLNTTDFCSTFAAHEVSTILKAKSLSLPHTDDGDRKDFNNTKRAFTIPSGTSRWDISLPIVNADDVNEAEEQLILVLEIDDATELNLDQYGGILILKILDNNRET